MQAPSLPRIVYFVPIADIIVDMTSLSSRRRWQRIVPAVLTFLLGVLSGGVGMFSVIVIAYRVSNNLLDYINYAEIFAGCFLYLGPGLAWTASGVLFWKGRGGIAWCLTLVGLLIPIVLFAVMGF